MRRFGLFVLGPDDEPMPCDVVTWALWLETHPRKRQLGHDVLPGGVEVSTVFIGIDYQHVVTRGKPRLWETMVLGGVRDGECRRYDSAQAARDGHRAILAELRGEDGRLL